jgi:hypothetical protein
VICTNWSRPPGAQGFNGTRWYRPIRPWLVTSMAQPVIITDQPDDLAASRSSTSKATTTSSALRAPWCPRRCAAPSDHRPAHRAHQPHRRQRVHGKDQPPDLHAGRQAHRLRPVQPDELITRRIASLTHPGRLPRRGRGPTGPKALSATTGRPTRAPRRGSHRGHQPGRSQRPAEPLRAGPPRRDASLWASLPRLPSGSPLGRGSSRAHSPRKVVRAQAAGHSPGSPDAARRTVRPLLPLSGDNMQIADRMSRRSPDARQVPALRLRWPHHLVGALPRARAARDNLRQAAAGGARPNRLDSTLARMRSSSGSGGGCGLIRRASPAQLLACWFTGTIGRSTPDRDDLCRRQVKIACRGHRRSRWAEYFAWRPWPAS